VPASGPIVMRVAVSERVTVTAKVEMPARLGPKTPVLILAHGANNDLDHPLLAALAAFLSRAAGTMVVRFNFPYVERGSAHPDAAPILENAFRRVHDHVTDELAAPEAPLFVGGKSLGGRTAAELISRGEEGEGLVAAGLVELGYPLHRPGHKESLFTEPLRKIGIPSLFCIGEHDPFCDPGLLRPLLEQLLHPARLYVVPGGDHSLHRARAGAPVDGHVGAGGLMTDRSATGEVGAEEFADVAAEVARFIEDIGGR